MFARCREERAGCSAGAVVLLSFDSIIPVIEFEIKKMQESKKIGRTGALSEILTHFV